MNNNIKHNTILNLIRTFASIVFPLITFPYISRVLLAENVGKISFSSSFVSYFSLIASLGISTYAIRECSAVKKDNRQLSKLASEIFSINVFTTIVAYSLLLGCLIFYRKIQSYRLLIVIHSLSIVFTTIGTDWINSAMEDFRYITIRSVFIQIVSLILMFVFVREQKDYVNYALITVFSASASSITNYFYKKRFCRISFTVDIEWERHVKPIMYLFVMQLAQTIFNSTDTFMLGIIKNDYQVGIYSTAHKISHLLAQVIGSVSVVLIPRLSFYFGSKNYSEANRVLRKALGFNTLIGLPCILGVFVTAKDIVEIMAGDTFAEAVPVLKVLMLSMLASLYGGMFLGNTVMLPLKKEKYYMFVCCITAAINIVANAILIPRYAANGAAIATALSSLLILCMLATKVDQKIKIDAIHKVFISPVVGVIVIFIVCTFLDRIEHLYFRFVLKVALSACSYLIIQIILKNELLSELIYEIKGKIKHEKE